MLNNKLLNKVSVQLHKNQMAVHRMPVLATMNARRLSLQLRSSNFAITFSGPVRVLVGNVDFYTSKMAKSSAAWAMNYLLLGLSLNQGPIHVLRINQIAHVLMQIPIIAIKVAVCTILLQTVLILIIRIMLNLDPTVHSFTQVPIYLNKI